MGTRRIDVEPDIPLLEGAYHPMQSIPVTIGDPVRIQELPCPDGSLISTLVTTKARHLISSDIRRRYLTILAKDDDIYIGSTQNEVDSASGAFWPQLVPLVLRINRDMWVRAANTQTVVTVISELWTE